ncbi:hypothetical protein LTR10_000085 [Elasticomyces elasticus]|nr:hypothetical protein LTR10_000085 [Elasticomyces elasticus]
MAGVGQPDLVTQTEDSASLGAAARVFAIPELLEMILLPLHQNTLQLFPLRRVNSTFHDLIRSSKVLRHYVEIQHPIFNLKAPDLMCNLVIPVPPGKTDICSPLDIFNTSTNMIHVTLDDEYYHVFKSSPTRTMVLLMAMPMGMKASWREILLAQVGDARIRFFTPGGASPQPSIAMEKDATLGWLVDRYMAELGELAARSEVVEVSREEVCTFRKMLAMLKEEVSLLRDGEGEGTSRLTGPHTFKALPQLRWYKMMHRRLSGTRQQQQGSAENAEQADSSRPSQLTIIFTNTSIYRTSGSHIMADNTPAEDYGEVVGPATKVFDLPELLEMVLQHLHLQHPLQLFTLRRVNSTFHAVIKDSRALRDYSITRRPASD